MKYRWPAFAVVVLFFVAAFNGHWRIGRDSAAFRGIARNLVRSHEYVFRPRAESPKAARRREKQEIVYPGMPLMLAGVQRVFGEGDLAPQVIMYALAAAVLLLVYRLMRRTFGLWTAVSVTVLLGLNRLFLVHANEMLSDLPFLFGLLLSLNGFERLRRAVRLREWVIACLIAACGLALAASMRPTFWILALAWIVVCVSGLIVPENSPAGRRRKPYAVALALLVALALIAIALDPRTHGTGVLSGGYEVKVKEQLSDLRKLIADARAFKTLNEHIPTAFFAFGVKQGSNVAAKILMAAYTLMVVFAGIALFRTSRLWGILVGGGVLSLALLGDNPRYYLMVLPLLIAGWCLFCAPVARWLGPNRPAPVPGRANVMHALFGWAPRHPALPSLAMLWGIGLVLVPNVIRDLDLIREQRGFDAKLHYRGFTEAYDDGKMAPLVRAGQMVKRSAPASSRILGPEPTILTYLSDRQVYDLDRMTGRWGRGWRAGLAAMNLDLAVFPPKKAVELYGNHDPVVCFLFDRRVLVLTAQLDQTSDGAKLGPYTARAMAGEHVKGSRRRRPTRIVPGRRRYRQRAAVTQPAATSVPAK